VLDYLAEFVRTERPKSIAPWVPEDVYHRVAAAARQVGTERLKPIFLALGEKVDYDTIRLVVAHLLGGEASA
jgi:ATP-dependent DNA helicase RecQ